MLVEAVKQKGIEGDSLLDVGGGIGAIQHELLRAGVAWADSVEARRPTSMPAKRKRRGRAMETG